MGKEIERKFLLRDDSWRRMADRGTHMRQAYLSLDPERSVRVRITADRAWLNIKSGISALSRYEFEYVIPKTDAETLLELSLQPIIDKTRYRLLHAGLTWEIDEFAGANAGLVVAEVELESEDQAIDLPAWAGTDVSHDPRYLNINLVTHPFCEW